MRRLMLPPILRRLAPLTGLLFVALFLVGMIALERDAPDISTASDDELRAYAAPQDGDGLGFTAVAFALLALVVFGAVLRHGVKPYGPSPAADVAFACALLLAATYAFGLAIASAPMFGALEEADPATVRSMLAWNEIWNGAFVVGFAWWTGLVGGASLAAWRGGLPRWLAVAGLVVAAIGLVHLFEATSADLALWQVVHPLHEAASALWIVVAGVVLALARPADAARTPA